MSQSPDLHKSGLYDPALRKKTDALLAIPVPCNVYRYTVPAKEAKAGPAPQDASALG